MNNREIKILDGFNRFLENGSIPFDVKLEELFDLQPIACSIIKDNNDLCIKCKEQQHNYHGIFLQVYIEGSQTVIIDSYSSVIIGGKPVLTISNNTLLQDPFDSVEW